VATSRAHVAATRLGPVKAGPHITRPTRVRAAGATDPGRVRTSNEDRLHVDAERGIFVVVDGVGGHAAGEVAATIARDIIVERLERTTGSPAERLREAIALANNEILRRAEATPHRAGMTCVVTAAVLEDGQLTVGHVGDTRLYTITRDGIRKRTHDHSPIGEREDAKEISEAEAMRHPRRNEVFRDIGGRFHDPDDEEFVELVEMPFGDDEALLVCSDGLTDMLTAFTVERTVRQHAGDPIAIAQALVDAANEAGGHDNVTVVYAEGERFASVAAARAARRGGLRRAANSRAMWLTAGLLVGFALAFALVYRLGLDTPGPVAIGRSLVVGGTAPESYATIADAIAVAAPRDVVLVEPGEYLEAVVLPAGVSLVARIPGSAVLVSPPGREGWVGLTASSPNGNHISGIRIVGTDTAPMAVGMRLTGHDVVVDDVAIDGAVDVGLDVAQDGAIEIRGSRFTNVRGVPVRLGAGSRPAIRQNVFSAGPAAANHVIDAPESALPRLLDNVFAGYSHVYPSSGGRPDPRDAELFRDNFAIRPAHAK
jgi:PPM family protein phosphatase